MITRDGENVDVDFTSNPTNINSEVGIGDSGWYQYVYTIKASNFETDGVYKIDHHDLDARAAAGLDRLVGFGARRVN